MRDYDREERRHRDRIRRRPRLAREYAEEDIEVAERMARLFAPLDGEEEHRVLEGCDPEDL